MSYNTALLVGALVIVAYTFLGGFMAVSWTDFFQGILMFCALIIVPVLTVVSIGSWDEAVKQATAIDPSFNDIFSGMSVVGIISLMAWGLGYFGQPHILARFMAIKSPAMVPKARLIGMFWMVFGMYGAIFVGFVGVSHFAEAPLQDPETVFIVLTQQMFNPWVAGILLAAILSAIMSTVDSQLLVCSSSIAEDFYKGLLRPDASEKELIWIGRGAVIAVAVIAGIIALDPTSMVLDLVSYAWAGFGAAFGPVVLLSLFWRGMTRNGAMSGLIVGALTVIIWKQLSGGLFDVYEILPGFIFASIAIIVVSKIQGEPSDAAKAQFDEIGG
jgi:sodium/proline symporter